MFLGDHLLLHIGLFKNKIPLTLGSVDALPKTKLKRIKFRLSLQFLEKKYKN